MTSLPKVRHSSNDDITFIAPCSGVVPRRFSIMFPRTWRRRIPLNELCPLREDDEICSISLASRGRLCYMHNGYASWPFYRARYQRDVSVGIRSTSRVRNSRMTTRRKRNNKTTRYHAIESFVVSPRRTCDLEGRGGQRHREREGECGS